MSLDIGFIMPSSKERKPGSFGTLHMSLTELLVTQVPRISVSAYMCEGVTCLMGATRVSYKELVSIHKTAKAQLLENTLLRSYCLDDAV